MDPGSSRIMLCLTGSGLDASREGRVYVCMKPKAECFILTFSFNSFSGILYRHGDSKKLQMR